MMKIPTYRHREQGFEVTALLVETADDVRSLHAERDWHEGQARVLTYPTADPILFVGLDNDVALLGRQVVPGQWVAKGPAGELTPIPPAMFSDEFELVEVAA
jgi:hypothetical protein